MKNTERITQRGPGCAVSGCNTLEKSVTFMCKSAHFAFYA